MTWDFLVMDGFMWFLMGKEVGFCTQILLVVPVYFFLCYTDILFSFFSRSDSRGATTPLGHKKKESAAITRNTGRL